MVSTISRGLWAAMACVALGCGVGFIGGAAVPALAQETTTYSYDALGRVTGVQHSGGPSNGTTATYTYDPADNRTNVTVTGSPNGGSSRSWGDPDNGAGAPPTSTTYIVVPWNGHTPIVLKR